MTPKIGQDETSVPHQSVFMYEWRHLRVIMETAEQAQVKIKVGDGVLVKPPNLCCTNH